MADYEVLLREDTVERVTDADAYAQEGQMTTFFATGGRQVIDCWSTRLASIRTADIRIIRRLAPPAPASGAPGPAGLRP